MKKKLIAVAVSAIATSGAFAQSNVEIYGTVDLAVVSMTGSYSGQLQSTVTPGTPLGVYNGIGKSGHTASGAGLVEYGSRSELASVMRDASAVGFRGSENLGGGLKASFVVESTIAADGNAAGGSVGGLTNNILGDRETTIALSNSYGQVKAGRQLLSFIEQIETLDPFGGNGPGNLQNLLINPLQSNRVNNSLRFDSSVMGVKLTYQHAASENSERLNNTRGVGSITSLGAVYEAGPLAISVAHLLARDFGNGLTVDATLTPLTPVTNAYAEMYKARSLAMNELGASYDFGVAKLYAQYLTTVSTKNAADNASAANLLGTTNAALLAQPLTGWIGKESPLVNSSTYMVGLTVPMGKHKVLGSFVSTNDKRLFNQDGRSIALGYEYALSKRTTVYARGTKVYNTNGSVYGVLGGGNNVALATAGDPLNRTTAYLTGVSHSF